MYKVFICGISNQNKVEKKKRVIVKRLKTVPYRRAKSTPTLRKDA